MDACVRACVFIIMRVVGIRVQRQCVLPSSRLCRPAGWLAGRLAVAGERETTAVPGLKIPEHFVMSEDAEEGLASSYSDPLGAAPPDVLLLPTTTARLRVGVPAGDWPAVRSRSRHRPVRTQHAGPRHVTCKQT